MCTGLPAFDPTKKIAEQELPNHVEQIMEEVDDCIQIADRSCRWAEKTYRNLFELGLQCVSERPKCRPSMGNVSMFMLFIVKS